MTLSNSDKIIDILHEAKARTAGLQREQFLAETCQDDPALREQVVSLLKAVDDEADSNFLRDIPIVRQPSSGIERPGDWIGRYKLLEVIGEGGCGVVYMAEQEEPVRRRVALKVIKLGMDTKQVLARFEAERQALALMDHPNIAKVLDGGATEAGRPFFVMELVRGIKITDYCDQNDLSTVERLKLFIPVCEAIQHAHQKGIIHRDIKPSNILVTRHDDVAVPKVIDFGVAKATTGQLTDKTLFTAFAQFIGTPAYMSPEQAQMSGLDIDTRADIYSLGILLYELLAGNTPFNPKELLAGGMDEMRRKILEVEPAKPSTRLSTMTAIDLRTVAKHRHAEPLKLIHLIRGDLDCLVMKCLEKDRMRRYETANGLADDIKRHLTDQPIVARPPSKLYRFRKTVQRNKVVFAATAAVISALIIGLCVASWALIRERAARREAELTRNHKMGVLRFLMGIMDPNIRRRQDPAMLRAMVDAFSKAIGEELRNEPETEGDLWLGLAAGCANIGDFPRAIANSQQALNAYQSAFGSAHIKVALALDHLGKYQIANKEFEGRATAKLAVDVARKCGDPELLALCVLNAAKSFNDSGKATPEAIPLLREAIYLRTEIAPNLLACIDSTRCLVEALKALAHEGKLEEAKAILQEELVRAPKSADLLELVRTFREPVEKNNVSTNR